MEYNILRDWLSNHQFTWEKLGDILTYHHNARSCLVAGCSSSCLSVSCDLYVAKETYVGSHYLRDTVFPLFLL